MLPQNHEGCVVTGKPHQVRFRDDAPRLFPELEGYVTRARPAGKLSIEVPVQDLAGIRAAVRCEVNRIVFLDRGESAGLEKMGAECALEHMMRGSGSYGPETLARHEKALRRLLRMPAYRLRYQRLEDAMEALESLTA
jgi:hypothetical protein